MEIPEIIPFVELHLEKVHNKKFPLKNYKQKVAKKKFPSKNFTLTFFQEENDSAKQNHVRRQT